MASSRFIDSRLDLHEDAYGLVLDYCNLVDITQLQKAYPGHDTFHISHVLRRISHFTKDAGDPEVIRDLMRATNSVFSGSLFPAVMDPELARFVRDLDLYVPYGFVQTWVRLFRTNGFEIIIPAPVDGEPPERTYTNGIASVTRLMKGNVFIDIVESETSSALTVILNHHSTPVTRPSPPPFDPN